MKMALSPRSVSLGQRLWNALSTWTIKSSGYQKMVRKRAAEWSMEMRLILLDQRDIVGLLRDDLLMEELPEVAEAIRRLPEKEQYLRLFRIKRALDLSLKHSLLPQDQWTKPEQDVLYLVPYIEQVKAEMQERKTWNKQ